MAFEALYEDQFEEPELKTALHVFCGDLKKQSKLEDILFGSTDIPMDSQVEVEEQHRVEQAFQQFVQFLRDHQVASLLPIHQFLLTLSMHLFTNPQDLALTYKLAEMMEWAAKGDPAFTISDCATELDKVAHNRLRVTGFSEEELEFDPDQHKGEVVVATIHKAKGLEWDRVYLVSANNYDFPSNQPYDQYISERYFIRDRLNLEAELLALLQGLQDNKTPREGNATHQARISYSAERLRLLYVGITRARKELVITWNEGKNKNCVMAIPFVELNAFWEQSNAEPA